MGVMVSVSPKFQIVIPKRIRELIGLERNQKLLVEATGKKLELIPIPKFEDLEGTVPELRKGPTIRQLRSEWND